MGQISHLSEMMLACKCFTHVSKILNPTNDWVSGIFVKNGES